jgi:WD40 repeat protein
MCKLIRISLNSLSAILFLTIFASVTAAQETFFQTGHVNDILEVQFSPDDSRLASYSAGDGRLILWDVKSGRQIWTRRTSFIRKAAESTNLKEFYWSKDAKTLVTKSNNGTYQTWDAQTGKVLALTGTKPEIEFLTPDKKVVEYKQDYDNLTVTDAQSGETKVIKRFGFNPRFNFSNDGTLLAEGGGWGDAAIKITEIKTGKTWWLNGHPGVVGGIAFSPDGKFLAVGGSDRIIYIFDTAKKTVARKLDSNNKPVKSISFSPDGKFLLFLNKDGEINVWEWQSGNVLRGTEAIRGIFGLNNNEFSKNGKYFLFVNEGNFGVWETADWKPLSGFKTSEKYESKSGMMTMTYDGVPVYAAVFTGGENEIITSHYDGSLRVWNINSGKQLRKFEAVGDARFLAFLGGQRILAIVGNNDKMTIKIFDAANGTEIKKFDDEQTSYIETLAVSPNGRNFVTSDIGGDVFLWNIENAAPVRKVDVGFSGDDAVAFSPDGKTFAVGGKNQNLFLFDVETGEKQWQLIPSYQAGELELKLEEAGRRRRGELDDAKAKRDAQAAIDTEKYKKQVYITFEHYGDMSDAGEKRMVESSERKESKTKKPRASANAVWLRLHNDSPLPVSIPTQSMYLPNGKCFFEFSNKLKINGLCKDSEISVWHGLKDKKDEWIPFGFDFGSSAILLPKTSVLFPVPVEILKNGNQIVFTFTFKKEIDAENVGDYGTAKELRFGEKDLPKTK